MISLPNTLNIDLSAIEHNLNQVRKLIRPETKIMGIVKSDAYGHGLLEVSRVLEKSGADCLGVAHLHEALELRKCGIALPIIILCGIRSREEAGEAVEHQLTPVLFDLPSAEMLAEESARRARPVRVQLKLDTGMGRLGIAYGEMGPFLKRILRFKTIHLEALTSHLSTADEPGCQFARSQILHFERAVEIGRGAGLELPLNNLANSAGIMAHKDSHFNMVRPGIMLYGALPCSGFPVPIPLRPAMSFKSRVIQVRKFPADTPVSYGRTYHTKGPQRIAIVSAGYGDGLPRSFSNRAKVLIGGKGVPVVGRVCMNMLMCNVTALDHVEPGSEAVLLGTQEDLTITAEDMAWWADSISYEILCSLGRKQSREYL
jgi:alanine racemase